MRTEEETKEIMKGLASSPDFLAALESCLERWKAVKDEEVNAVDVSFYMFCEGYLSCLDYIEVKDKLRGFKYEPNKCLICNGHHNIGQACETLKNNLPSDGQFI